MLKRIRQQKNRSIDYIETQAALTLQGLSILLEYFENPGFQLEEDLRMKEKEADGVRSMLISDLNHSFITPFDREDLFNLSRAIDDILDYVRSTVSQLTIFQVKTTPYMFQMALLLKDASFEISQAVQRLQDYPDVAAEHAKKAKKLENEVEDVYRHALAELFDNIKDISDIGPTLKHREVYRHLSNAADRGDEAANILDDIIMKNT